MVGPLSVGGGKTPLTTKKKQHFFLLKRITGVERLPTKAIYYYTIYSNNYIGEKLLTYRLKFTQLLFSMNFYLPQSPSLFRFSLFYTVCVSGFLS